jgi:hypothetical protein
VKVRRPVVARAREIQQTFIRFGVHPGELDLLARAGVNLAAHGIGLSDVVALGLEALADRLAARTVAPAEPPKAPARPAPAAAKKAPAARGAQRAGGGSRKR